MAPNPIMIPRKPVPTSQPSNPPGRSAPGLTTPLIATSVLAILVATVPWARSWLLSGAAIESILLIYGSSLNRRVLADVPLWTLLATFNLIYAICSTSWLLHALFSFICYLLVLFTSVSQFPAIANLARKVLRKTVGKHPHFIKDKIALFNLPALEIDTDLDGLMAIRGVTLSLSTLTLVAHGIELGLKIANDVELAIYVDEVTVSLFRRVEIGDVYANIKGGPGEMTFGGMDEPVDDDSISVESLFVDSTPMLGAARAGAEGYNSRPKLRETMTGVSYVRDSSARAGLDIVTRLSPDDEIADKQYHEKLTEIRTTSAVYQSRQQVRQKAKSEKGYTYDNERDMRAAVAAELHRQPSVPHPPTRSIRVTTLQKLSPPYMRRFMHRLPFLLRLLLAPLSYFHSVNIASINGAGTGEWLATLLQQQVFKQYTDESAELRRLQRRIAHWLADANFCLQLTDIEGLGQVPLSSSSDIVTYLKFKDVMAYRTSASTIKEVVRLGGADATFSIPSYLLPHHEHLLPAKPTPADEEQLEMTIEDADGIPQAVQAEHELEKVKKDETSITMSVHGSLPISCDQSLLNFAAAIVKATKIIELEKDVDEVDSGIGSEPPTPTSYDSDSASIHSRSESKDSVGMKEVAGFKVFAKKIHSDLKDGTTKGQIRDTFKQMHQSTKDGVKKAMVQGLVNDRWIAKMVGKTAAMLQKAQGDVGYSGGIPVALAPYRGAADLPSKLLP